MNIDNVKYELIEDYEKTIELTEYEKKQVEEIIKWKKQKPGVLDKTINVATMPFAWLAKKVIPDSLFLGLLNLGNHLGNWLADGKDIVNRGNVSYVRDLKYVELERCDNLANEVHDKGIAAAAIEGGGTGVIGIGAMAIDIPALVTLALRTINKIGLCYGYESNTEEDREFCLAILSAASSNSLEEKTAALSFLKGVESALVKKSWQNIVLKTAENKISEKAGVIAFKSLSKQLGVNITKRKALASIPVIGAVIGGSMNAWYIREIGWCARRNFQERWLIDNEKIDVEDIYTCIL